MVHWCHRVVPVQIAHNGAPCRLNIAASPPMVVARAVQSEPAHTHHRVSPMSTLVAPAICTHADPIAHLAVRNPLSTLSGTVAGRDIHEHRAVGPCFALVECLAKTDPARVLECMARRATSLKTTPFPIVI